MLKSATRFAQDESGATAVEYGLLCALIFIAIIAAVSLFAHNTQTMFNAIATNYH
ncbi:MAG: Flp family type IVb pilin [Hyphomicrobiales bacterium]|nr:Flp family type IVb pilin [Hyphomicrobiales bacterium]MDE2018245.1 Flp family type IVb pilin [Hyphomicrobiales bacterium]